VVYSKGLTVLIFMMESICMYYTKPDYIRFLRLDLDTS